MKLSDMIEALKRPVPEDMLEIKVSGGESVPYLPWYRCAELANERLEGRWSSEVVERYSAPVSRGNR